MPPNFLFDLSQMDLDAVAFDKEAVLKAVNLGDDTDTTGAVVGGLAGIVWGFDLFLGIPNDWVENLQKLEKIKRMIAAVNVKMQTT